MLAAETSDLIEFHGGLDWALRDEAFRSASAVVVPSRAEPFGMVVVEAMECGVPVLYTGEYEKRSAERLGGAYLAGARNTAPLVRAARAD